MVKENVDKALSRKIVIKEIDQLFSRYKRLENKNDNGLIRCFTCGKLFPYSVTDCGHFVGRQHLSLRWEERNTEPQCIDCNRFHEGVKDVFALNLQKKYGVGIIEELNTLKHQERKWSIPELLDLQEVLKKKIKSLEA